MALLIVRIEGIEGTIILPLFSHYSQKPSLCALIMQKIAENQTFQNVFGGTHSAKSSLCAVYAAYLLGC